MWVICLETFYLMTVSKTLMDVGLRNMSILKCSRWSWTSSSSSASSLIQTLSFTNGPVKTAKQTWSGPQALSFPHVGCHLYLWSLSGSPTGWQDHQVPAAGCLPSGDVKPGFKIWMFQCQNISIVWRWFPIWEITSNNDYFICKSEYSEHRGGVISV